VEGKIYLTWKGKFGNQGVDLGEVSHVSLGIGTDVLKKAFALNGLGMGSPDLYLSVVCAGRSVDLSSASTATTAQVVLDLGDKTLTY
jgi:hypothetical protein